MARKVFLILSGFALFQARKIFLTAAGLLFVLITILAPGNQCLAQEKPVDKTSQTGTFRSPQNQVQMRRMTNDERRAAAERAAKRRAAAAEKKQQGVKQ
jgi:hypothetical protein